MADVAISVQALRKVYPREPGLRDSLRAFVRGRLPDEGHEALKGIDLRVEAGTSLGVVGRNGSGKTTLLRVLAGILRPTSGSVEMKGRIAGLLELGSGIDPAFTGGENAILLGVMAGATRREMRAVLDDIREFSGLGTAFDQPIRSYSSGMVLRLAFSTAVHCEPDILLIDEVLAVGDAFFQQSCLLRVRQLQSRGCTIVLVTHDPSAVMGFCQRAIWLEHGRIASAGDPAKVVREYLGARYERNTDLDQSPRSGAVDSPVALADDLEPASEIPNIDNRYGDGAAVVEGIALRDELRQSLEAPAPGETARIVITIRATTDVAAPIVGFTLRNRLGEILTATNTNYEGQALPAIAKGDLVTDEFSLRWPHFGSGMFSFSPSVADGSLDHHAMNDWIDNAIVVEVSNPEALYGWLRLEEVGVRCARRTEGQAPVEDDHDA